MEDLLNVFKALSHPVRLQILGLLRHGLCVGALAKRLDISEGAVSRHLGVLREAGLVTGEKRGYWTHYRLQTARLQDMAETISREAEETAAPAPGACAQADCPLAGPGCQRK